MADFLQRLKRRKLVQWALAYAAFAFALLQGVDIVAQRFAWPVQVERLLILALAIGFLVVLVLAWYHGERGAQKLSGTEIVILALLLAVGGGLLWQFGRSGARPATVNLAGTSSTDAAQRNPGRGATPSGLPDALPLSAIPAKSIAVLPFENLSEDRGNAYFVTGMQGLILTKLAEISGLKVIARTSTRGYGSHPGDLATIRRELGVATVLEGGVQKQGDEVLINVRLVDTGSNTQLWAQSYARTLKSVFGVEGEVAGKVADALKAELSPVESEGLASGLSTSQWANDLFLRAEYQVGIGDYRFDTGRYKAAIPLYREAIGAAPDFALALARLSYVESILAWGGGGGIDVRQLVADAREHAERALQLDPHLPAARIALGYSDYYGRNDYPAALKIFASVTAEHPNNAGAWRGQGYIQRRRGPLDAAIASFKHAIALDPRNSLLANELAFAYKLAGRYADAERWDARALALNPDNRLAMLSSSWTILLSTGDIPRALAAVAGDDPALRLQRVFLLTLQRKYEAALALLDSIPDTPDNFAFAIDDFGPKPLRQAELNRLLGREDRARALYAAALSRVQASLAQLSGINRAYALRQLARAELGLGRTSRAMDAVAQSEAINARSDDKNAGPHIMQLNATVYAQAGRADLAVPLLAKALASPGGGANYSPVMLWIDPAWEPIRHDPRFQTLLKKYANYKPAVMPAAAGSADSASTGASGATAHD